MQDDIYYIKNIKFGLMSSDEIIKNSVCNLDNHKLTGIGSVYDPRMGTIENNIPCAFCDKIKTCPGHFGHIQLKYPIIHPLCWKFILSYLKYFCYKCSIPLISKDMIKLFGFDKFKGEIRFKKILAKLGKIKLCHQCNTIQPQYSFVKADNSIFLIRDNKKTQLNELEIKKICENIPDKYIELLGFDPSLIHPKNMIITVLPVIPIIARPYIRANADLNICDDDLTTGYSEIIKANIKLHSDNLSEAKKNKNLKTIQFRVKCLFDNSHEKSKHTNGRPTKCIKKRISSKEGLIRNNIMGKRVDKSARTVIGPDPSLSIGQIALPRKFAQTLTFPERVNRYNFTKLTEIVNSGQANFVIRNDTRMNLKYAMFRYGTHLLYGDEIHRDGNIFYITEKSKYQLQDGDKVKRNGEFLHEIKPLEKKQFNLQIQEKFVAWHQDVTYWGLEPAEAITAWFAIDDSDRENGCMSVIPESHHDGIREHGKSDQAGNLLSINQEASVTQEDEKRAFDLILKAGEMSIHHGKMIHGSLPNRSTRRRCGLTIRYIPPWVKQIEENSMKRGWKAILLRGQDQEKNFGECPMPFSMN